MYVTIDTGEAKKTIITLLQEDATTTDVYEGKHDQMLHQIDRLLYQQHKQATDISGIIVKVGEGSFTATRLATTLANTWHFVLQTPVVAKADTLPCSYQEAKACCESAPSQFIQPQYSGEPNIGKKN